MSCSPSSRSRLFLARTTTATTTPITAVASVAISASQSQGNRGGSVRSPVSTAMPWCRPSYQPPAALAARISWWARKKQPYQTLTSSTVNGSSNVSPVKA